MPSSDGRSASTPFREQKWERRHHDGLREQIVQTAEDWCEGYILHDGFRYPAGRGTSHDRTAYVLQVQLGERAHRSCETEWRQVEQRQGSQPRVAQDG